MAKSNEMRNHNSHSEQRSFRFISHIKRHRGGEVVTTPSPPCEDCSTAQNTAVQSDQLLGEKTVVSASDCCEFCLQKGCSAAVLYSNACTLHGPLKDVLSAPGYTTLVPKVGPTPSTSPTPTPTPTSSITPSGTPTSAPTSSSPINGEVELVMMIAAGVVALFVFFLILRTIRWRKVADWCCCCCCCCSGKDAADPAYKNHTFRYLPERLLGEGTYGCVFLATRLSDRRRVALKYIPCEVARDLADAHKELTSLMAVQGHDHVVNVLDAFGSWPEELDDDPQLSRVPPDFKANAVNLVLLQRLMEGCSLRTSTWGHFCIVTDYYAEGTMYHLLMRRRGRPLSEGSILRYTAQICLAVDTIHSCDMIHRDLKPGNLLMTNEGRKIVITDFGLTRALAAGAYAHTRAGTLHYFAPEQAQRRYTNKADIWAIGCLVYSMATRRITKGDARTMFMDRMKPDFERIVNDDLTQDGYSSDLAQFMLSLLVVDPRQRPTAREALDRVQDLIRVRVAAQQMLTHQPPAEGGVGRDHAVVMSPPVDDILVVSSSSHVSNQLPGDQQQQDTRQQQQQPQNERTPLVAQQGK